MLKCSKRLGQSVTMSDAGAATLKYKQRTNNRDMVEGLAYARLSDYLVLCVIFCCQADFLAYTVFLLKCRDSIVFLVFS